MSGSPIVKMLGAGIGLASEAIHQSRAKKAAAKEHSNSGSGSNSPAPDGERSEAASRSVSHDETPSQANYDYNSNDAALVGPSTPVPYDAVPSPPYLTAEEEKRQKSLAFEEEAFGFNDDEAIWELDDMAEHVDPPAYSEVDHTERADGESRFHEGLSNSPVSPSGTSTHSGEEGETAEEASTSDEKVKKEIRMVRELVRLAGPPPVPQQRLPFPVIIPQRRPRDKSRGFVRAYAPDLGDYAGIDQDVFLKFLKGWHLASKASPWIDVVYVAAGIAGFVPELGAQIASVVVQVVAGTARELQSRHRNNSFLDRANQELFMPRGLFAMVMAFKDEIPSGGGGLVGGIKSALGKNLISSQRLDLNQTTVKYSQMTAMASSSTADPNSRPKFSMKSLRKNNGLTYSELELPQAAQLVYPDLDRAAEHDLAVMHDSLDGNSTSSTEKAAQKATVGAKWHNAGKFVQDYLDRRSQAEYESQHLGSSMAVPSDARKPFMSRYADPNHPANSGSLVALLTGGAVVRPPKVSAVQRIMNLRSGAPAGNASGSNEGHGRGRTDPFGRTDRHKGLIGMGIGYIASGVSSAIDKQKQKKSQDHQQDQNDELQQQPGQYASPAPYGTASAPAPYGSSSAPSPYGSSSPSAPYESSNPSGPNEQMSRASADRTPTIQRTNNRTRGIKKMMQQDVLYLLVVNLPTDEEVQASVAQLEELSSRR